MNIINEIKGRLKLGSYKPKEKELEFMRNKTWESRFTNHPRNYPLQQYGVSKDHAKFIIELIKTYINLDKEKNRKEL